MTHRWMVWNEMTPLKPCIISALSWSPTLGLLKKNWKAAPCCCRPPLYFTQSTSVIGWSIYALPNPLPYSPWCRLPSSVENWLRFTALFHAQLLLRHVPTLHPWAALQVNETSCDWLPIFMGKTRTCFARQKNVRTYFEGLESLYIFSSHDTQCIDKAIPLCVYLCVLLFVLQVYIWSYDAQYLKWVMTCSGNQSASILPTQPSYMIHIHYLSGTVTSSLSRLHPLAPLFRWQTCG